METSQTLNQPKKTTVFQYEDPEGLPALKVVRKDFINKPKEFYQTDRTGKPIAPYRYKKWKDFQGIHFLVEGEKLVEFLESKGLVATTTPGGSNNWRDSYAPYFKDKHVVILPDNDEPGKKYCKAAVQSLWTVCKSLKVIDLPHLEEKEDVYDWAHKRGGTKDKLLKLVETSPYIEKIESRSSFAMLDTWEDILSINEVKTQSLSSELFPSPLGNFIAAVARSSETPIELPAMMALGVMSVVASGSYEIETEKEFYEPLNLYMVCPLDSGNRKTSVLNVCKNPIEVWELDQFSKTSNEIKLAKVKRKNEEAQIKALRNALASRDSKKDCDIKILGDIETLEENLTEIPISPRLIAADITPERLPSLMRDQNEKIGILSDEGGFFEILGGRYSSNVPNLDLYLKGFDGSSCRVDRQNAESIILRKPLITTVLCPQPSVIQSLATKSEFRDRGMIARFLFAIPQSPLGNRKGIIEPVPKQISEAYENVIKTFLPNEAKAKDEQRAIRLKQSKDAYEIWKDYWLQTEANLKDDGKFGSFKDWGSKLPGKAARIAGLFHLIENHKNLSNVQEVSKETMLRALTLAEILEDHAVKAFHLMAADPNINSARVIIKWLMRTDKKVFSQRDCHRALHNHFPQSDLLDGPLQMLVDRHYIREIKKDLTTGRPKKEFAVNPNLAESSDKSDKTPSIVNIVTDCGGLND